MKSPTIHRTDTHTNFVILNIIGMGRFYNSIDPGRGCVIVTSTNNTHMIGKYCHLQKVVSTTEHLLPPTLLKYSILWCMWGV